MKHYYLVKNSINETDSDVVAIRETFEEAKEVIKTVEDWYCPKGSGTIVEIDENMKEYHSWYFYGNELRDEYDYIKNKRLK